MNPKIVGKTVYVGYTRSSRLNTHIHSPIRQSPPSPFVSSTVFVGSILNKPQTRQFSAVSFSDGSLVRPPVNHYLKDDKNSRNNAYLLVGVYSAVGAMAAKNIVTDYLQNLSASADVLALAKVEVDMAKIPEGKNVVVKWKGKPIFIRHRTQDEIAEANSVDINTLIHKQTDSERVQQPAWLVMIGVCTHLGCVPIGEG